MVVKIDGIENKDFGKDKMLFLKFLKENTSSGKVSAQVEVFKAVDVQKDSFHWVMSTFDTDRDCDLIYRKQELLEFSICSVPANLFALHVPQKKLEITNVIQDEELSFFEKVCSGLKARA